MVPIESQKERVERLLAIDWAIAGAGLFIHLAYDFDPSPKNAHSISHRHF